MRGITTDPLAASRLAVRKVPKPIPAANEALIKVQAISLNQGETRTALAAAENYIPGWDFAGVIERAAADGSTPQAGTRVFGFIARGSWAEYLAAPGWLMAEIPADISNAQAACLPIAAGTALSCIEAAGSIAGRSVLVTGAAGGVGRFICQLAQSGGARVFAVSRRPDTRGQLQADGVTPVDVFTTMADAKAAGYYDVIIDAVGGDTLSLALTSLTANGICINYGNSSRQPTVIDVRSGGWPMHGIKCIWLGRTPDRISYTPMLEELAALVQAGQLRTPIQQELSWLDIATAAEQLVTQRVDGKIVLHVD